MTFASDFTKKHVFDVRKVYVPFNVQTY